jgi:hypothetical protein
MIIAVDDEEYYTAQARPASEVHPSEEAKLSVPSTGLDPIPVWMEPIPPWPTDRVDELNRHLGELFGWSK